MDGVIATSALISKDCVRCKMGCTKLGATDDAKRNCHPSQAPKSLLVFIIHLQRTMFQEDAAA